MNTAQFIIPAHSPLQRNLRIRRSGLAVPVAFALGAHLLLFGGLLVHGWMREQGTSVVPVEERLSSPAMAVSNERSPLARAAALEPAGSFENLGQSLPQTSSTTTAPKVPAGPASERLVYEAKSGDTLTKIARLHGTTVSAIRQASDLRSDRLALGQKIVLPEKTNGKESSPLTEGVIAEN